MPGANTYLKIEPFGPWTLTWEPPRNTGMYAGRMHMRTGFGPFAEADGSAPGLHIVWDSNKGSADYYPRYFNRAGRLLVAEHKLAWGVDIPEDSRRLRDR